ncbi:hypothetical protein PMAYCL1PPCAC_09071, partial [Pristionchus mayeri]
RCIKDDCEMFNQLICVNCALFGGHGGHVEKYRDKVKIEQTRQKLTQKVSEICSKVEEKKNIALDMTRQINELCGAINSNLKEAEIPEQVLRQLDNIDSDAEAAKFEEIVQDLAKTIIDQCDSVTKAFEATLKSAKETSLPDSKSGNYLKL